MRITQLTSLDLSGMRGHNCRILGEGGEALQGMKLTIEGGEFALGSIALDQGSTVEIEVNRSSTTIFAVDAPFETTIDLNSAQSVFLVDEKDDSIASCATGGPLPHPERLAVYANYQINAQRPPTMLTFPSCSDLLLSKPYAVPVSKFLAFERQPARFQRKVGTIIGGKLNISDIDKKPTELASGDALLLEGVEGRILRLEVFPKNIDASASNGKIDLEFEGVAKKVTRQGEDLTSTFLEYLFYRKGQLALILAAVMAVGGVLWPFVRKLLSGQRFQPTMQTFSPLGLPAGSVVRKPIRSTCLPDWCGLSSMA